MTKALYILVLLLATTATPLTAWAQQAGQADKNVVTKAQQLRVRMQLMAINGDPSMAAKMSNGLEWSKLSADQQEKIRGEVLAFTSKSEAEQEKLLTHYERLIRFDAPRRDAYLARAAWLRVVMDTFTTAERQTLESLPPQARAARILERKEQCIREGRLPADPPAEPAK